MLEVSRVLAGTHHIQSPTFLPLSSVIEKLRVCVFKTRSLCYHSGPLVLPRKTISYSHASFTSQEKQHPGGIIWRLMQEVEGLPGPQSEFKANLYYLVDR